MDILGYVGFAVLVVLAVTWTIGVRVKLDAGANTILGAVFFIVGAGWLSISGADRLHSLWLIPAGFVFAILAAYLSAYSPMLFGPFRLIASLFAAIIRLGIPAHRIRAAQEAGLKASIEEWASRREDTK
jgi:hypothetical protein